MLVSVPVVVPAVVVSVQRSSPATWCYIFSSFFVRMSGLHVVAPSGVSLAAPSKHR